MTQTNYYEVLGVSQDATLDQIKESYRKKAMKLHPDRHHALKDEKKKEELKNKFSELQEAYSVLSDPKKRNLYDAGKLHDQGSWGGASPFDFGEGFSDIGDIGDIFSNIFGGRRNTRSNYSSRGADLRHTLSLHLEDIIFGNTASIEITRLGTCTECHGTGSKDKARPVNCPTCHGQGQVHLQRGPFAIQQACPSCHGQGQYIANPCRNCRGSGQARESRHLSVKIPAGVAEGDQIRLAHEGEAGVRQGPRGDLYVKIHIKSHSLFTREGNDLHSQMPVSYVTATLGGEIEVPTVTGRVKVHIPKGTPNGKAFKLKGKGIPKLNSQGAGDLLLTLMVEVPTHLNKEQTEILKTFEVSLQQNSTVHYPSIKKWVDSIKKFFTPKEKSE